jgi:hypothetical protein
MEVVLWVVCILGVNLICISLVAVAYLFRKHAKVIALAFPAVVPLFLLFAIRGFWQPDFVSSKFFFFAASMANFFVYIYVWHRWIGRL